MLKLNSKIKDRVLVIGAHMDDEVLGCGGSISKHKQNGDYIHVCFLTDSSTCQYEGDSKKLHKKYDEAKIAGKILGVDEQTWLDFPDMKLDTITISKIAGKISDLVTKLDPTIIYTHSKEDLNRDHRIAQEATLVAARPMSSDVLKIYSYPILSSTEWNHASFNPNTYVVLSRKNLDRKIEAMKAYQTELRDYPHPRSIKGMEIAAKSAGLVIGKEFAEPLELVRYIR